MTDTLNIALAQVNVTVGNLADNYTKIIRTYQQAKADGADLVIFPEMVTIGYPAEDLVLRPQIQEQAMEMIGRLAKETNQGPAMLLGSIHPDDNQLFNAAFLLENGAIANISHKHALPNSGVFDEQRIFKSGPFPSLVKFKGLQLGIIICHDLWQEHVVKYLAQQEPDIVIGLNGSPYEVTKAENRNRVATQCATLTKAPLIYMNLCGAQDEIVFDGHSFVMKANGNYQVTLPGWQESLVLTKWENKDGNWHCQTDLKSELLDEAGAIYETMKSGLHDYVIKNHFPGVILGLSGGIDSALTAAIAVDALGADKVHAVMMPSPYTSPESLEDAAACANLLGIKYEVIPIVEAMEAFDSMLSQAFVGTEHDLTEENVQSRIRGLTLMALSNKFGSMVLSTGNKSELAVGYATLYGDMCGGYNALKDLYKTQVFATAKWRNEQGVVIPERIITKAPSAELRHDQKDEDSLPPYDILDDILEKTIEDHLSTEEIANTGHDMNTVQKVVSLLQKSEYKRRQAAPGVKLSGMSFGKDRRYPITNGFRF